MRIAIVTALHKRYRLTELFLAYYAKTWQSPLFCVHDDNDLRMWSLVQQFPQWEHVEHANEPLADKWLSCMDLARRYEHTFDAVMILGSDDFIDAVYKAHVETYLHVVARDYAEKFSEVEFELPELQIQPRYVHYFDANTARLISRKHKRPGAGVVLSNALLERLDWKPWRRGDRNIDGSMTQRLSQVYGDDMPTAFIEDNIGCILDVKTPTNMWSFDHLATNNVTAKSPVEHLDAEEYLQEHFPLIANHLLQWNTQEAA